MRKFTPEQLLANEVEQVFRQFVHMPNEHCYTAATLWVQHTHLRTGEGVFLPYVTPRMYFGSKIAGCGKSLATELTTRMSHNGEVVLEPTPPSVTTLMNQDLATLGFDEIDTYFGRGTGKQAMRAILNGGYKRGAKVTRQRADETDRQNCHGPICLNGKNANLFMTDEKFETLRSRSICIILEKKPVDAYFDRFNPEVHEPRIEGLMKRLKRWGVTHGKEINCIPIEGLMPRDIANRAEEIWTVLFRIAHHLGGDWPERCEKAARAFELGQWDTEGQSDFDDTPCVTPSEELLAAVQECFHDDEEFLPTATIIERLEGLQEPVSLMDEWKTERSANMGLARGLGVYAIKHVRRQRDGIQEWGYTREDVGCEEEAKLSAVA